MLIKSYGLFWKSNDVNWGRPNSKGTLLGIEVGNKLSDPIDFRYQIGVYALYDDNFRVVYVGQAGTRQKKRLFGRLKDHTRDDLAERWTKFSWFGLLGVRVDGELTKETMKSSSTKPQVLDHIEAILISATEPPHNRQGGRFGREVRQFRQYRDHDALGPKPEEMLRELHKNSS